MPRRAQVVILSVGLCVCMAAAIVAKSRGPGLQGVSGQKPAAPPAAQAATYVGEETCLTCHADMTRGYHGSAHGRAANPRSPAANKGCESCHGPGSAHVEDPAAHPLLQFDKAEPREASQACLTCHRRSAHALWDGSSHEARNLTCSTCHSVHDSKSGEPRAHMPPANMGAAGGQVEGRAASSPREDRDAQLNEKSEIDLCARCHRDKVAKLDRSGHMPVREGKMTCSSCHNPHGSTNERLLNTGQTVVEACTRCHADKRGPYLWEHAPVSESCTTCHDPHGSANERMLIAKLPMLCQRCHIATRHPSTIYDAGVIGTSNRLYARSCVTCHSNIHGSNHASGNMFVR